MWRNVLCFGELSSRGEKAHRIFRQLERVVSQRPLSLAVDFSSMANGVNNQRSFFM